LKRPEFSVEVVDATAITLSVSRARRRHRRERYENESKEREAPLHRASPPGEVCERQQRTRRYREHHGVQAHAQQLEEQLPSSAKSFRESAHGTGECGPQ